MPFDRDTFDANLEVLKLYIDSAKVYIQIATGAVVFSLTFTHKPTGCGASPHPDWLLALSWIVLLVSILFGMFYIYLAAKQLDSYTPEPGDQGLIRESWIANCGHFYGVMLVFFYVGLVLLSYALFRRL